MSMYKKEKNYAFIDNQNVYMAMKAMGWRLDWEKLRRYLKEKYSVETAYMFIGYLPGNRHLYEVFQKAGYIVIFKDVLENKDGTVKGNVDVELVLQVMMDYPVYDQAIIMSGDGDFASLIKYLVEKDKFKMLLVPNQKKYSFLLRKAAKKSINSMDALREKLEIKE